MKYIATLLLLIAFSFASNAQRGEVNIIQDNDIDKLLEYKKDIKTAEIYTIQVYNTLDPDLAEKEKLNFLESFDKWKAEIHWNTPNYKVWVGKFATRLEADRALAKIKKKYIDAIILQPKLDKK